MGFLNWMTEAGVATTMENCVNVVAEDGLRCVGFNQRNLSV